MTTARDVINQSLKAVGTLGVGQTALAEDVNDAFRMLQQMLAQWQKRRWLVPALRDIYGIGNNLERNTIGAGGYYNITRPDKIQSAYVRLNSTASENNYPDFSGDFNEDFNTTGQPNTTTSQTVDFPLAQLFAYEDYSRIALKGLNSFPQYFFYDAAFPMGNLFVWPIPSPSYEVHLIVKTDLPVYTNLNDDIDLPPEFEEAIWTNLTVRLAAAYNKDVSRVVVALAKSSLNTIRNANTQIPRLVMPPALVNVGNYYNFFSDQYS
jgi:hypothetical protein